MSLLGIVIRALPTIIQGVVAVIDVTSKAMRRRTKPIPAGTIEAEERYQRASRHIWTRTDRSRCLFCNVPLTAANELEHCLGPAKTPTEKKRHE